MAFGMAHTGVCTGPEARRVEPAKLARSSCSFPLLLFADEVFRVSPLPNFQMFPPLPPRFPLEKSSSGRSGLTQARETAALSSPEWLQRELQELRHHLSPGPSIRECYLSDHYPGLRCCPPRGTG